jgi:hypothetical protein
MRLVGTFALDDDLLLFDSGFSFDGLGFPRIGGRLASVGALLAGSILSDLRFGDRLPFRELGFRPLPQRGVLGDGSCLDALMSLSVVENPYPPCSPPVGT